MVNLEEIKIQINTITSIGYEAIVTYESNTYQDRFISKGGAHWFDEHGNKPAQILEEYFLQGVEFLEAKNEVLQQNEYSVTIARSL